MRTLLVGVVLLGAGCTQRNPDVCPDGICVDPDKPYCDMDGSVAGTPQTCIPVTCEPNSFIGCHGDNQLSCNASGTDYTETVCQQGCDSNTGCKAAPPCTPNTQTCANGVAQTCDANGVVTSSETCSLGCFEAEPRCRRAEPSNDLGMFLDTVSNPPVLDLQDATIDVGTGVISDGAVADLHVPSFTTLAPSNGVEIRVFVVDSMRVAKADIRTSTSNAPAVAFVAHGDIEIDGMVTVQPRLGSLTNSSCAGKPGTIVETVDSGGNPGPTHASGGGGGGGATVGGAGGKITSSGPATLGGAGGNTSGIAPTLIPLRGGCDGGAANDGGQIQIPSGVANGGGAALQISTSGKIMISGAIVAEGGTGDFEYDRQRDWGWTGGGGSGGSVLLEGADVVFAGTAPAIDVGGGNGGAGCDTATASCGLGGAGATGGLVPGSDGASIGSTAVVSYAGGGGGGLGFIRFNTPNQMVTNQTSPDLVGVVSKGQLKSR